MPLPIPGRVADIVRQSTVVIKTGDRNRPHSSGSGVVLSNEQVITNAHVIHGRSGIQIEPWEGSVLPAKLIRLDRSRDLALIAVPGLRSAPLPLSDSQKRAPVCPCLPLATRSALWELFPAASSTPAWELTNGSAPMCNSHQETQAALCAISRDKCLASTPWWLPAVWLTPYPADPSSGFSSTRLTSNWASSSARWSSSQNASAYWCWHCSPVQPPNKRRCCPATYWWAPMAARFVMLTTCPPPSKPRNMACCAWSFTGAIMLRCATSQ